MSSRLKELESSEENVTRSDIVEIRTLLQIADEILWTDYYIDDEELPTPENPIPEPICACCGGEVFQTAFCCAGDCLTDDLPNGLLILVCPLCYVEGRTCQCRSMRPVRFRDMATLLEVRDSVHEFVRRAGQKFLLFDDENDDMEASSNFHER